MVSTTPKLLIESRDHPASYVVYYDADTARYRAKACFDGGTDYNDPLEINVAQPAYSALVTLGGGTMFLKGTSHNFTTPLLVGDSKIKFSGEGRRTTIINGTTDVFKFNALPVQCVWEDMLITTNGGHCFNIGIFGALNCKFHR